MIAKHKELLFPFLAARLLPARHPAIPTLIAS